MLYKVLIATYFTAATASYEKIVGYSPGSKVTDHNAIDLDQADLETSLSAMTDTTGVYTEPTAIYTNGGHSKSYTTFAYAPTMAAFSKGATCTGLTASGGAVSGTLKSSVSAGATSFSCVYDTTEIQASYQFCQKGGLPTANHVTSGCMVATSDIVIAGTTTLAAADLSETETKGGRTLKGFASSSTNQDKMYTPSTSCPGCPYDGYQKFYNYYGTHGWADDFISGALAGTAVSFPSTPSAAYTKDANFVTYSDKNSRTQAVKKGTAYMNVWMYVIREFEDAIDDCSIGSLDNNYGSVHAWDEGVAFYAGSLEGTDGSGSGKLVYNLADKRAENFDTCGAAGTASTGTSKVNIDLLELFRKGRNYLLVLDCAAVRPIVTEIEQIMTIPLIQGTLRYAYKMEMFRASDTAANVLKYNAEGAVFAMAVLPYLAACSASAAKTVYDNMKYGAAPTCNKAAVKAAFEANYACMGVTCADVGALNIAGGCVSPTTESFCSVCYDSSNVAVVDAVVYEKIAGYTPRSEVTDHNAIDLDQAAMETELAAKTAAGFALAKAIYTGGGNSKSNAVMTVSGTDTSGTATPAFSSGDSVIGMSNSGMIIEATMYSAAAAGATSLKVKYPTNENQANYNGGCQVGSLVTTTETGCFQPNGTITIGWTVVDYTAVTNGAGRTLQGFATTSTVTSKMYSGCPGCPYDTYMDFYNYYGDLDYADKLVTCAFDGTNCDFTTLGDLDFSTASATGNSYVTREQVIKKGTAYMNTWMYVIREFEDAIDDCETSSIDNNYGSAHAWDEGVAFWTGSLEGTDGSGSGKLIYALAEKRCANFNTCGASGTASTGTAKVNLDLFAQFAIGQNYLYMGQCSEVRPVLDVIIPLMAVPLIQGTLRYAYKQEAYGPTGSGTAAAGSDTLYKYNAEGAIFAAAVLPMVHACSATAAATIYDEMKVGAENDVNSAAVKAAFESVYACMGVTCASIGGLQEATDVGSAFGTACVESPPPSPPVVTVTVAAPPSTPGSSSGDDSFPVGGIVGIAVAGVLALFFLIFICVLIQKEKQGQPMFTNLGVQANQAKSPPV